MGQALPGDIDEHIQAWHEGDSRESLPLYLGMEPAEYARWIEDPEQLEAIIEAHRT